MKSLVINAGSSSIKFQVFEDEKSVLSGLCDAIGLEGSKIKIKFNGEKEEIVMPLENHKIALAKVIVKFANKEQLVKAYLDYDRNLLVADVRRKEAYKPGDSKARKKRQSSKR